MEGLDEMVLRLTPPNEPENSIEKVFNCKTNFPREQKTNRGLTSRRIKRSHLIITFREAPGSGKVYN